VVFLQEEDHEPIKRQRTLAREVGRPHAMARDKLFVAQTLAQRGDELREKLRNGCSLSSHPKGSTAQSKFVQS
jgi:hypothetical protein